MTVINIRGTSGSGKSTLVKRFLDEHPHEPIYGTFSNWKKPKVIGYKCWLVPEFSPEPLVYVIGRYETQCGGCDSMSYKGSHDDIEAMVREYMKLGNVIFEGLTISSTLTRWRRISDENPGEFFWAFMMTPEEECHRRILTRNGGKEPKHNERTGLADYQIKYRGCMRHIQTLVDEKQSVLMLNSDDMGYETVIGVLDG